MDDATVRRKSLWGDRRVAAEAGFIADLAALLGARRQRNAAMAQGAMQSIIDRASTSRRLIVMDELAEIERNG